MKTLLCVCLTLCCVSAWGKDPNKDEGRPALTAEQKSNIALAQRDLANGMVAVDQLERRVRSLLIDASKNVDAAKWTLNPNTLEYEPAPPAPAPAKPADAVPAKPKP